MALPPKKQPLPDSDGVLLIDIKRNSRRHHGSVAERIDKTVDRLGEYLSPEASAASPPTRVCRLASGPLPSLFYDITAAGVNEIDFMLASRPLFPDGVGIALTKHKEGSRLLYEITVSSAAVAEVACTTDLLIIGGKILPASRALDCDSKVLRVNLSNIPHLSQSEVIDGLLKSLQPYGCVLELHLFVTDHGARSKGKGYVYLELMSPRQRASKTLAHRLPWHYGNAMLHARWHRVGLYCGYCYADWHAKAVCPELKNYLCYDCQIIKK